MNNPDPVMFVDEMPADIKVLEAMQVGLPELGVESLKMHLSPKPICCHLLALELRKDPAYENIITDEFVRNIYHAASLHDCGKISVPDHIPLNIDGLNPDEQEAMKRHVDIERRVLRETLRGYKYTDFTKFYMELAAYHHEKWDGTGYPEGLYGRDIPLPARIMALVDVYDAMRSRRSGKERLSHEKCVQIIKEGGGVCFDPSIVKAFTKIEAKLANLYDTLKEDTPPICKA